MARPRRPNERPSYQAAPVVPAEMSERFTTVAAVVGKALTVSDGARRLGIARPNFQTLVHRVEAAMISALTPRPSGPSPRTAREVELERRVAALEKANAKLTSQLHTMDRLLGAAGEVIRELRTPSGRSSTRSSRRSSRSSRKTGADPEPGPTREMTMRDGCASSRLGARALGVGASTLRRWRRRGRPGPRRTRRTEPSASAVATVRSLVRELRGLAGAAALSRSVPGISRREAARVKRDELTRLERERKAQSARVEVTVPGAIRGFDAMDVATCDGRRQVLAAGDACVGYRTSLRAVHGYTGDAVARALDEDFAEHGPPLVCRMDRAACHRTGAVASVLSRHGVLVLHGPPRYPRYYGQLERQNREHRAWLDRCGPLTPAGLADACRAMRIALNERWRRPTLKWCTASMVWAARPALAVDRLALRDEVEERAARRRAEGVPDDMAQRLAIEHALRVRQILRVVRNERVLCE